MVKEAKKQSLASVTARDVKYVTQSYQITAWGGAMLINTQRSKYIWTKESQT